MDYRYFFFRHEAPGLVYPSLMRALSNELRKSPANDDILYSYALVRYCDDCRGCPLFEFPWKVASTLVVQFFESHGNACAHDSCVYVL